jgi:diamine N-acetyltransferase
MDALTGKLIKLKPVDHTKVAELRDLGRQTYKQHFSEIWSDAGLQKYLNDHFDIPVLTTQLREPAINYFLIQRNHQNVGLAKIKIDQRIPAPPFDHGLELEKLYFLSSETGKGFGSDALVSITEWAKKNKTPFVWLDVLKSNEKAFKLYQRLGFQVAGEIGFATDIRKIDMWIMRQDLESRMD